MPALSSISTALQAVLAQSQVLDVTQQNISNASTPGYRRQSALLTASVPSGIMGSEHGIGAGQRGGGVTVDKIQRFNLEFFDGRYRLVSAEAKNWEAQSSMLGQLEATLAETGTDGLTPKLDEFWAGWQAVSDDPTNQSLRGNLLDNAGSLANAFTRRSQQITQLRSDQNDSVSSQVGNINSLAGQIADLNGEISRVLSVGEQPNDLMDKRDLALDQLSQLTGSVSFMQKNGEVAVSIGGHSLVVGHDAMSLDTKPKTGDTSVLDVVWSDGLKLDPPNGQLKGTLEARDKILVNQLNGLNSLAANLIAQVNTIHKLGFDLNNVAGKDFFTGSDASSIAVNSSLDANSVAASSNKDQLGVVQPGTPQPGNNEIAIQMAGLKTTSTITVNSTTMTFNAFYNSQVTNLALVTQHASDNSYHNGLVAKALSDQRESVAGVSLDEEAANMATAQKAYQAAARVMNAYDEMLDLVINRMGLVGR